MLTCRTAEKASENIRVKILEGAIYTVDDVSDLLGIPRPTLYRYLREYSIPHLRRGGRIQIPEDSFDRIREARDLHKEGLGTESVRRQLREGGGPDTGELDRRLDELHETLEDLKGDLQAKPATNEVALSPALRTILARQSLMLSAMFNLTGMVEDLLLSGSRARKRTMQWFENDALEPITMPAHDRAQIPGTVAAGPVPMRTVEARSVRAPEPDLPARFGSLSRRRRRGALAALSALVLTILLVFFIPTLNDDRTDGTDGPAPRDAGPQKTPEDRPAVASSEEHDEVEAANDSGGEDAGTDDGVPTTDAGAPPADERPGSPAREGKMPDVSGRPLEEAARTLSGAGYTIAAIRSEPGTGDPGTVTGTEPAAGAEARPGAPVVLITVSGPAGATAGPASATSASASATASPAP